MRTGRVSRDARRASAEERAAERAKLTDEQQLAKLDRDGRTATKERARLEARIAAKGKSG
jgi:hypothetical protein